MFYGRNTWRILACSVCLIIFHFSPTQADENNINGAIGDIITDNATIEKLKRLNLTLEQEIKNRELLLKKKTLEQELSNITLIPMQIPISPETMTSEIEEKMDDKPKSIQEIEKNDIFLSGIIQSGNTRYASLRVKDGTSAILKLGESIAGWKLVNIEKYNVTVQRGEQTQKLSW